MIWKCAEADIPLGGGKDGIIIESATDVGTNPQMMGWMMDEFSEL